MSQEGRGPVSVLGLNFGSKTSWPFLVGRCNVTRFLSDVGARACPEDASVFFKIAFSGKRNCLSRNQKSSYLRT